MSSIEMIDVLNRLRELDKKNPNVVNDAVDNTERMNGSVNEAPLTRQQAAAMQNKANAAFDKLDREVANQKAGDNNLDARGMPTPGHPDYEAFQAFLASRNKGANTVTQAKPQGTANPQATAKNAPTAKPQARAKPVPKGPYVGWKNTYGDEIVKVAPDGMSLKMNHAYTHKTKIQKFPTNINGHEIKNAEEYISYMFRKPKAGSPPTIDWDDINVSINDVPERFRSSIRSNATKKEIADYIDYLKNSGMAGESVEEGKKAKPDFLDVDKDGNKKEPMKKALKDKEKVKEGVTISCDTPEEASAIARMMQLAGLQQVTPDMMPGQDNVPVVKPEASCGCGDTPEYENAPEEQYSDVAAVTTDAGLDGVNGKKAPQDIRVKDPSPHEDFEVGRLKDLAGIESEEEVEEEWDNEPDEHYKEYDADEYADKDGHATAKTRQVPAKSGDNPLESIEHNLLQAYEEFLAKEETN